MWRIYFCFRSLLTYAIHPFGFSGSWKKIQSLPATIVIQCFEEIVFPMTATVTLTTISIESVLETLCTCSMCNAWKRRKRSSRSKTFSHWLAIIVLYFVSAHSTLTFDSSSVCQTRRNHKGCGKINTYCDWNWKTFQSTEQVCCVSKITILFMVHILFACAWPVCLDSNTTSATFSLSHTHTLTAG